jgi:transcriptional regulator with XRE-family HTH domain
MNDVSSPFDWMAGAHGGIDTPWMTRTGPAGERDNGLVDRASLAQFLRTHREALQPSDVGLSVGSRRRTKGLRREEVAALAAMSTDYYTRLEQRRGPVPSEPMLAALARALRLSSAERTYLFQVAGRNPSLPTLDGTHVAPALMRVLDRLSDTPALIVSSLGETLVQNHMAAALFGDASGYSGWDRSGIYRWFTNPGERVRYPENDWDRQSRAQVANLRAAYGSFGPHSRAAELVKKLQKESEEFARLWEHHEVAKRFDDHKTLIHPALGPINVDCQALFTEDQAQALLVLTARPQSEDFSKLQLVAVLGNEQMSQTPKVETVPDSSLPGGHPPKTQAPHRAPQLPS